MIPLFSVIITTFNRPEYLETAINSVLQQSEKDWELIIIDDGSEKETKEVVKLFNNKRIRYIYQQNQKLSAARNKGISHANGEYICFLDDDDFYKKNHLRNFKCVIEERNHPEAFFYTGINRLKKDEEIQIDLPAFHESKFRKVLLHTIYPSSVCISKKILDQHKFKTEHLPAEDRALWAQIVLEYPLIQIPEYSIVMRKHEGQTTELLAENYTIDNIEKEVNIFRNLFKNHGLREKISESLRKQFFSQRYYFYMYSCLNDKRSFLAIYLYGKFIYEMPTALFKKKTFKALKDIFLINFKHLIRNKS